MKSSGSSCPVLPTVEATQVDSARPSWGARRDERAAEAQAFQELACCLTKPEPQLLPRKGEKHRLLHGPRVQPFVQVRPLRTLPGTLRRLRLRCVTGTSWSQPWCSLLPQPCAQASHALHQLPSPSRTRPPLLRTSASVPCCPHALQGPTSTQLPGWSWKLWGHDAPLCSSLPGSPNQMESETLATDGTGPITPATLTAHCP